MVTFDEIRELALSFPEAYEEEHFGMPSFRVKKKIFSTLWLKEKRAMVKLTLVDQSVFTSMDSKNFFPVTGGWGTKGATFVELSNVDKEMFADALMSAYRTAAPRKLSEKFL